jgi:CRISPR system Cascade subunit CasC
VDEKKLGKLLKDQVTAMRAALSSGVDIALSGRMATSGLMSELGKVDGAMSIAHAITTHAVESDIDWFTAVDDLQDIGSGHLGTQEFSSGVFYRYASLNISQLQYNLGGADRGRALEVAGHLAHMLATEIPNAKQRSFAAFNPADLVMVSFSDFPLSLANAFEQPIESRKGGYLKPSVEALNDYWGKVAHGYGLNGQTAQFQLAGTPVPKNVTELPSLEQLKGWIRDNGGA